MTEAEKRSDYQQETLKGNTRTYRNLTPEEAEVYRKGHLMLEEAMREVINEGTMYSSIALDLDQYMDPSRHRASVGKDRILWNPFWLQEITVKELTAVMLHEVMHVAFMHHWRMKDKDHRLWNIATDFVINAELRRSGFTLPEDHLYDPQFEEMDAENVYTILESMISKNIAGPAPPPPKTGGEGKEEDEDENAPKSGSKAAVDGGQNESEEQESKGGTEGGKDSDQKNASEASGGSEAENQGGSTGEDENGASEGDSGDSGANQGEIDTEIREDWNYGSVEDATEGLSEGEISEAQAQEEIRNQAAAIGAKTCGQDKGDVERIVKGSSKKLPFVDSLRSFMQTCLKKDDYTFKRPNRRYIPHKVYLPSLHGDDSNHFVFAIDISGSVDDEQLKVFADTASAIIDELQIEEVTVIFCNNHIQSVKLFGVKDMPMNLSIRGGGGTCFRPPFEYVQKKGIQCKGLIYFTDLLCNRFPDPPQYPVLWTDFSLDDRWKHWRSEPPFGMVVKMDNNPNSSSLVNEIHNRNRPTRTVWGY